MGWNISNILVNEAIANKKAGGGGGELESRVEALETTVNDLGTAMTGVYPDVYSTTATKIGKWGTDDLYRVVIPVGSLTSSSKEVEFSLPAGATMRKLYGSAVSSYYFISLPYVDASSVTSNIELIYNDNTDKIVLSYNSDRSGFDATVVVEYSVPVTNNKRKRGK